MQLALAGLGIAATFLALLVSVASGQKALILTPGISGSQLIFYSQCAEVLQRNGFNVTMLIFAVHEKARKFVAPPGVRQVTIDADPERKFLKLEKLQDEFVFASAQMSIQVVQGFMKFLVEITENGLKHQDVLNRLKAEKYDIGFAHSYNYGATGFLEALDIKSTVLMPSGNLADHFYWWIGVPTPWSYVPCLVMPYGDRMTLVERFKNAFCQAAFLTMSQTLGLANENAAFQKVYGPSFPKIQDLIRNYQLVMINSEEFIDLPRPILHKVIYIAGLNMGASKPLDEKWDNILKKGKKGVVVFALGSVAPSEKMPAEMRKALIEGFKRFPDYHFIFRFDGVAPEMKGASNIDIAGWMPQKDILNDPRVKLFITHGGFNSLLESSKAGVPMVIMPLFGDQMGNAVRARRAGIGVQINKLNLTADVVYEAVKTVLYDSSYAQRAKKLARMISKKPMSPEDRFVKWARFLAEFKTLETLRPVSADLGIVQYFNLDVYGVVLVAFLTAAYILKRVLGFVFRKCCGTSKVAQKKGKRD